MLLSIPRSTRSGSLGREPEASGRPCTSHDGPRRTSRPPLSREVLGKRPSAAVKIACDPAQLPRAPACSRRGWLPATLPINCLGSRVASQYPMDGKLVRGNDVKLEGAWTAFWSSRSQRSGPIRRR
jgi:hypothetical protein